MRPCHIVKDDEEAGEVGADVEVEVSGRREVGDAIPISDWAKEKKKTTTYRVVPLGARSTKPLIFLSLFLLSRSTQPHSHMRERKRKREREEVSKRR